jgi:hypothetical protein
MGASLSKNSGGSSNSGDLDEIERALHATEWLPFRDHTWRPIEPGTLPLVDGATKRMGSLRGYGNALCAPQAQGFIEAFMELDR